MCLILSLPDKGKKAELIERIMLFIQEGRVSEGMGKKVAIGAVSLGVMFVTHKLFSKLKKSAENTWFTLMLREPIVIDPGEAIEKMFWLEHSNELVKMDFDTIKMLS